MYVCVAKIGIRLRHFLLAVAVTEQAERFLIHRYAHLTVAMEVMVDSCKAVVCAGEERVKTWHIPLAFLRLHLALAESLDAAHAGVHSLRLRGEPVDACESEIIFVIGDAVLCVFHSLLHDSLHIRDALHN